MHTGAHRLFLALLTSAYREEEVDGEKRTGENTGGPMMADDDV